MTGLLVDRRGEVLWLTINRPERRNSVDYDTNEALLTELTNAATDSSLRAVVLSSTGDHFCSGMDIGGADEKGDPSQKPRIGHVERRMQVGPHRTIEMLRAIQLPVIAAVRGYAYGLGCHFALACDYVVAGKSATFWEPFVERGFNADSGATWLLPRLIGTARAKEMLLLGRKVSAEQAASWGMINEAVDDDLVASRTEEVTGEFARAATVSVGVTKWLVHHGLDHDLRTHMDTEAMVVEMTIRSDDFKEGIKAMKQRRPPEFTGR